MSLTSNVTEKANLLWNIAEKLTGSYKPHEYGLVILPLTVIRRFDCILESTHEKVLEKALDGCACYHRGSGTRYPACFNDCRSFQFRQKMGILLQLFHHE